MTHLEAGRVERDRRMQSAYSGPSLEVDEDTWVEARTLLANIAGIQGSFRVRLFPMVISYLPFES